MIAKATGYVQLLGAPRVRGEPEWISFVVDKRYQLLAYLAYSGDWVSRERLVYLFWPDTTTQKAQQNLRGLLHRIRSLEWQSGMEVEAQRLRWPVETDVSVFKRALEQGRLEEALSLYGGPLLEGLESDEAPEFSSWLEIEREHLHASWRDALLKHVEELQGQDRYGEAAQLLSALLERDELDEEALAAYLSAAARAGQREQALKSYRQFATRLRQELDMEPTSTVQRLAQAIQDGNVEVLEPSREHAPSPAPDASSLPAPATSFVGRELELSEITHLLLKPECRLLTLTGPGGIGKTRIAMQALGELAGHFPDGSYFVPLDALESPELIASTIANVLGLPLQGQHEPLQQIARRLGDKPVLLALDNFERLLDGATLVSWLIQGCPQLKVLVTSRERLNLAEEWLLPVAGLPYPESPLVGTPPASPPPLVGGVGGGWADFDAIALFLQRAGQVRPGFTPAEEDIAEIVKICRLVEGSPLALELAAVWVRVMSCREIAEEIERNLDILSSSARDLTERHSSLRATFEYSWNLLAPVEQALLRKLSVFRGGFSKEAAAVVVGASIAVLASLVDKSLLRVTANGPGRYDRHPLMYQYTQEKLAEQPQEAQQAKERHAAYFLELAETAVAGLKGSQQHLWLARLAADHDNLRAAMAGFLEARAATKSLRLATALRWLWVIHGHFAEGLRYLQAALELGGEVAPALRAGALSAAGVLARRQGELALARAFFEESLALWRKVRDLQGVASSLQFLGVLAQHQGDYGEARALHQESLAMMRELHDKEGIASSLLSLGNVALDQGEGQARALYEESLRVFSDIPDKQGVAYALDNLGVVAWAENDQAAPALTEEAMTYYRELGNRSGVANAVHRLGLLAFSRGDYEEARARYQESLAVKRELGEARGMAFILYDLARLDLEQDELEAARRSFDEGLGITLSLNAKTILILYLEGIAALHRKLGQPHKAARLLGAAASLRRAMKVPVPAVNRARHERELAAVRGALDQAAFEAAWQEGEAMSPEEAVAYAKDGQAEIA
jgi:predicted ATPase/DNA-binding SARP family transcriptional activator